MRPVAPGIILERATFAHTLAHTLAGLWLMTLLLLGCDVAEADVWPTERQLENARFYVWVHLPSYSNPVASNPNPVASKNLSAPGLVVLRWFRSADDPSGDLFVLPLDLTSPEQCTNADSDPLSCIQPLTCSPSGADGECGLLQDGNELRAALEKTFYENLWPLLDRFKSIRSRGHGKDWININEILNAPSWLSTEQRSAVLTALHRFSVGERRESMSSSTLKEAYDAMTGLVGRLESDLKQIQAADELGEDWDNFRHNDGLPRFQFGWIANVAARRPAAQDRRSDYAQTEDQSDGAVYLDYYRLVWWDPVSSTDRELREGLAPDAACLRRLRLRRSDPQRNARDLQECLDLVSRLLDQEGYADMASMLADVADRYPPWQLPNEETEVGDERPFLRPLIRDECRAQARDAFAKLGTACSKDRAAENSGASENWLSGLIGSGDQRGLPIYNDWLPTADVAANATELDWWRSFRSRIEGMRNDEDRFIRDDRTCIWHIKLEEQCVSWWNYLYLPFGLLLVYLLVLWRRAIWHRSMATSEGGSSLPAPE